MPGFSADPGGIVMVTGSYIGNLIQSQVVHQGPAGREILSGDDPRKGGTKLTCWVQSGELQAIKTGLQG